MTDFLVIRLHPAAPVDPGAPPPPPPATGFAAYLTGLVVTVYARSFEHPTGLGVPLGSASYDDPDPSKNTIVQDLSLASPIGLKSVATAVVPISVPPGSPDYNDIVVSVTRGGKRIVDRSVNYDVSVYRSPPNPSPLPPDGFSYATLEPVALYLTLPDPHIGVDPSRYVDLPQDGSPPNFSDLRTAVNKVLEDDPGGSPDITRLTPDQCTHIANEILFNRDIDPLPQPPGGHTVDDLYTAGGSASDTDRQRFESDLTTYYTIHGTKATVLAKYIYSMSAALACASTSHTTQKIGFSFPILPGLAPEGATIAEATVVISQ